MERSAKSIFPLINEEQGSLRDDTFIYTSVLHAMTVGAPGNMQCKGRQGQVLEYIYKCVLPHFRIPCLVIVRKVNRKHKNDQQGCQEISSDLDKFVRNEGNRSQDKSGSHNIHPGNTPGQVFGYKYQHTAGLLEMINSKNNHDDGEEVDGDPGNKALCHNWNFFVNNYEPFSSYHYQSFLKC